MACNFQLGETVVLSIVITDQDNVAYDPSDVTVTITDGNGTEVVSEAAMINDGVGLCHYNYNSSEVGTTGLYTACYKAEDTPTVTIVPDTFRIVTCP
jgi:hypothetical protein